MVTIVMHVKAEIAYLNIIATSVLNILNDSIFIYDSKLISFLYQICNNPVKCSNFRAPTLKFNHIFI